MKKTRLALLAGLVLLPALAMATLQVGDPAPNFSIPDSTGTFRSLSEFRGQVVQILFWANF
ncbi:MAG: hypothetical protein ABIK37_00250 [candidate division WOR-3 bacterium]